MDTSAAEAVPGVVAIFTAKDVPNNEYGLGIFDQPVLVGLGNPRPGCDVSRWEGDQVAMIVAETEAAAARARELIAIEWESLPVVTDPSEAMTDAVLIHPEREVSNAYVHFRIRKGDMAVRWAAADVVVEGTYRTPMQEHAYLQPESGLGFVDEEGRVTVVVAGQWVHEDQEQIMHALQPSDKVRVIYGHRRRIWRARGYVGADCAGAGGVAAARAGHQPAGARGVVAGGEHYRPPQAPPGDDQDALGSDARGQDYGCGDRGRARRRRL